MRKTEYYRNTRFSETNLPPTYESSKSLRSCSPNHKTTGRATATRGLLATDHVILNHGQVTWTTPELAPPLLTTTPHQRRRFSSTDLTCIAALHGGSLVVLGLELVTRQATIRIPIPTRSYCRGPQQGVELWEVLTLMFSSPDHGSKIK
ncbi:uncharacterized protein TNCV_4582391 [Trichonephila clavipes]|nr:uncharacterized protein TNCV_4582391 [Trichonephila clavipes]